MTRLCQCGCGEQVNNRFVHGHNNRGKEIKGPRYVVEDRGYDTPCWIWQLHRAPNGYGHNSRRGGQKLAHRSVYVEMVGPIPEGLELDHLCKVKLCVNPSHLEPVTREENFRRSDVPKLTPEMVQEIRESDEPSTVFAERFGVSSSAVRYARNEKTWKTVGS